MKYGLLMMWKFLDYKNEGIKNSEVLIAHG